MPQSPLPTVFWGTARLDGQSAPQGTEIVAFVNGARCGAVKVNDQPGFNYRIDVHSAASQAGCGSDGAEVRFTIAGLPAEQTGEFTSGHFKELDLTATSVHRPAHFHGAARIDGQPASAGTPITALVNGNECGSATVGDNGSYALDVRSAAAQ